MEGWRSWTGLGSARSSSGGRSPGFAPAARIWCLRSAGSRSSTRRRTSTRAFLVRENTRLPKRISMVRFFLLYDWLRKSLTVIWTSPCTNILKIWLASLRLVHRFDDDYFVNGVHMRVQTPKWSLGHLFRLHGLSYMMLFRHKTRTKIVTLMNCKILYSE